MRKLATAAFSFTAATVFSIYLLPFEWLLYCSAIAAAVSLSCLFFYGHTRLRILIIFISLSLGFLWCRMYTAVFVVPSEFFHAKTTAETAVILDYPSAANRGYRVDCAVITKKSPRIKARLYYFNDAEIEPGDVIEFTASFLRADGSEERERNDALLARGVFLTGYVSGEMKVTGHQGRLRFFPVKLADRIASKIDTLYTDDVAPFMKALLVGKRDDLFKDTAVTSSLSAAGISHVVSISGMHVAFLMGFLSLVIKNKRLFSFIGIPVLLLFMAMTGFTPSVTRAGVMQIFLICAPVFRRESDSLTSLSAALLLLLVINPYSAASVSLQLSFAATLGIILFTSKINSAFTDSLRENKRFKNKVFKAIVVFISSSFSTTIGALVFTLPLSVIHFGYISLITPVTNLLTLWAVSVAFPIGIITCILGFIFTPLGLIPAFLVVYAARYIIFVSGLLSRIPYSTVYSSNFYVISWLANIYVLFVTLPLFKARIRQYLLPVSFAVLTLCLILFIPPLLPGEAVNSITVLDVGQGLSAVVSSGDYYALIDCGSTSGENAGLIAHEFLQSRGRTSIDLVVLTHFHADHVNGVEFLLSRINVSALVIPDPEGFYLADDIIQLARKRGIDIIYVTETLNVTLGELELVLYPPMGYGDENERGLSVLCLGQVSALLTGDMNSSGERSLLRYAVIPRIDLLIAGHHGSRYSTSEELLTAANPDIAVISVGRNSYGHPADATLERLRFYSVTTFRTDQTGHVTFKGGQLYGAKNQRG